MNRAPFKEGEAGEQCPRHQLAALLSDHSLIGDPYPLLSWLRENDPVAEAGGMRFVTRYDDAMTVYRDQRFSRQRQAIAEVRANIGDMKGDEVLRQACDALIAMLIHRDQPDHRRLRRILEVAFKPTRIAEWLPRVEAVTDELIAGVEGKQSFDLLHELAYPLPEKVICELMGVPHEDHALWGMWTETVSGAARTYQPGAEQMAAVRDAQRNFYLYFQDLVKERSKNLGDDLVSMLIRVESEGDRLSELEVLGTLQLLIMAGHDTTANLIGNGMYELLQHPDQYRWLREDPDLVTNAVEEMLRYASPSHWSLPREALEDVAMGPNVVPAGCPVVVALNAANRDPELFEEPETFDIRRKNNRHIAFAVGPHFCLGNQLARQEARVMFRAIVTRLPELKLAGTPVLRQNFIRALDRLPVRIG